MNLELMNCEEYNLVSVISCMKLIMYQNMLAVLNQSQFSPATDTSSEEDYDNMFKRKTIEWLVNARSRDTSNKCSVPAKTKKFIR